MRSFILLQNQKLPLNSNLNEGPRTSQQTTLVFAMHPQIKTVTDWKTTAWNGRGLFIMSSFVIIIIINMRIDSTEDDIIRSNTMLVFYDTFHCIYFQLLVPPKSIIYSLYFKLYKNIKNLNHVSLAHSILPSHSTRSTLQSITHITIHWKHFNLLKVKRRRVKTRHGKSMH